MLDGLEVGDAAAERPALLRILARHVVRRLRYPQRLGADADAAAVQGRHRDAEPSAFLVEQAIGPDPHALHDDVVGDRRVQPELLLVAGDAYVLGVEHEGGDASSARRLRVGAREEEERACIAAVGDPLLGAGDRPAVLAGIGTRAQRSGVRAGFGLGEREGSQVLAPREWRHETGALLLGAEGEDGERHCARVHGHRDSHACVGARELLEHEDVREEVGTGAPVLLRDARAHETELGEPAEELVGKAVLAIPFRGVRLDLGLRELTRERLDLALLGRELELHSGGYIGTRPRTRVAC